MFPVRLSLTLTSILMIFVIMITPHVMQSENQNTAAPTPTNYITADPFNMTSATIYYSEDSVVELKIPAGWRKIPSDERGLYLFQYQDDSNHVATITVKIGNLSEVYSVLRDDGGAFGSIKDLLEKLEESLERQGNYYIYGIYSTNIGPLSGYQETLQGPTSDPDNLLYYDIRVVSLSEDTVLMVAINSPQALVKKASAFFDQFLNWLVVRPQLLPTRTATPTPNAQQLTATALEENQRMLDATEIQEFSNIFATFTAEASNTKTPSTTKTP